MEPPPQITLIPTTVANPHVPSHSDSEAVPPTPNDMGHPNRHLHHVERPYPAPHQPVLHRFLSENHVGELCGTIEAVGNHVGAANMARRQSEFHMASTDQGLGTLRALGNALDNTFRHQLGLTQPRPAAINRPGAPTTLPHNAPVTLAHFVGATPPTTPTSKQRRRNAPAYSTTNTSSRDIAIQAALSPDRLLRTFDIGGSAVDKHPNRRSKSSVEPPYQWFLSARRDNYQEDDGLEPMENDSSPTMPYDSRGYVMSPMVTRSMSAHPSLHGSRESVQVMRGAASSCCLLTSSASLPYACSNGYDVYMSPAVRSGMATVRLRGSPLSGMRRRSFQHHQYPVTAPTSPPPPFPPHIPLLVAKESRSKVVC